MELGLAVSNGSSCKYWSAEALDLHAAALSRSLSYQPHQMPSRLLLNILDFGVVIMWRE